MAQITQSYVLQWTKMVTPKVVHLGFKRQDNTLVPFKAGQFITLHIQSPHDKSKILHRSYSIANAPNNNEIIEIACSYVKGGVATELLFNLKPGDLIEASGPYGIFLLKDETPTRYILVATGTGVSPYRSMLHDLHTRFNEGKVQEAIVLLGVRDQTELLFGNDFLNFAQQNPNFKFGACYSRETRPKLESFERKGYVQNQFSELNLNPNNDLIYLCGNPNMIDEAFASLTDLGFNKQSIRREKYAFSH